MGLCNNIWNLFHEYIGNVSSAQENLFVKITHMLTALPEILTI